MGIPAGSFYFPKGISSGTVKRIDLAESILLQLMRNQDFDLTSKPKEVANFCFNLADAMFEERARYEV